MQFKLKAPIGRGELSIAPPVAGTELRERKQVLTLRKEKMNMARQILVPFNSHLRIKDTLSVIKQAAKPGMNVVLLIRYPVDPWAWFRDHWVTTESSRDAILAGKRVMDRYSQEGQKALAEEIVAPWRNALKKIDVEVTVDIYTGSLSSLFENYSRGDEIAYLMRPKNELPIMRFFYRPSGFILKTAWSLVALSGYRAQEN